MKNENIGDCHLPVRWLLAQLRRRWGPAKIGRPSKTIGQCEKSNLTDLTSVLMFCILEGHLCQANLD